MKRLSYFEALILFNCKQTNKNLMCSNRIEIDRVEIIEINDRISVTKLLIRSSSMMMMMMRSLVMIIQVLQNMCV